MPWEPFKDSLPSHTVIGHYVLHGQMPSKAHTTLTTLTAPLVLHYTRIDKCAMKTSVSMANCRINFFWSSSFVFHLQKPIWKLSAFINCAMVLTKRLYFFFFSTAKGGTKTIAQCTLVSCGGVEFLKLIYRRIYNRKSQNKKNQSKCAINIHRRHLCCCIIGYLKTSRRSNTLKGSQRMGGGLIFLKAFCELSLMTTYQMSLISVGSSLWTVPLRSRLKVT